MLCPSQVNEYVLLLLSSSRRNVFRGISFLKPATNCAWSHIILGLNMFQLRFEVYFVFCTSKDAFVKLRMVSGSFYFYIRMNQNSKFWVSTAVDPFYWTC